jgi:hypothetical protein
MVMMDKEVLRSEAAHYRLLTDQLKQDFGDLDDETLKDTLEGLSDLPDLIEEIVRSSLEDDALITGLKTRLDDMNARLSRLKARLERKRELATWAMGSAGIPRLDVADFSAFLRQGSVKLVVSDEKQLPLAYLIPQPPKIDRGLLLNALKRGEAIDGAMLATGEPHIAVRTK